MVCLFYSHEPKSSDRYKWVFRLPENIRQQFSPCAVGQITFMPLRHPVPSRGAARDRHERGAGCGGRWFSQGVREVGGRRSRVVLTPRRWR
jgi:hypothetical protein